MAYKQSVVSAAAGYGWYLTTNSTNPLDSTTYYVPFGGTFTTTSNGRSKFNCPKSGTLNKIYGSFNTRGTLGSSENVVLDILKNGVTTTNVSSVIQLTSAIVTFSASSLGISITAGDYLQYVITTPAWATNPTTVSFSATSVIE